MMDPASNAPPVPSKRPKEPPCARRVERASFLRSLLPQAAWSAACTVYQTWAAHSASAPSDHRGLMAAHAFRAQPEHSKLPLGARCAPDAKAASIPMAQERRQMQHARPAQQIRILLPRADRQLRVSATVVPQDLTVALAPCVGPAHSNRILEANRVSVAMVAPTLKPLVQHLRARASHAPRIPTRHHRVHRLQLALAIAV